MKIALISDTHYGVRADHIAFLNNSKKFLDNTFFPTLEDRKITTVFHLGDVVDRRKFINFGVANRLHSDFLTPLNKYDTHIILGNHDVHYKHSNELNFSQELNVESKYPNIKVYKDATEVVVDKAKILLVPWICDDNIVKTLELITNTDAKICFGHLELQGFLMYKTSMPSTHGLERKIFNKFDVTASGHFHHKSSDGKIFYVGSHGEFTWADYNDPKGFHIFDTDTQDFEFIENPYKMFHKVFYDDKEAKKFDDVLVGQDFSNFEGSYCKIVVQNKSNPYWYDKFVEVVEKSGVINIQTVEDHKNVISSTDNDITANAESTIAICSNYIKKVEAADRHDKTIAYLNSLYEAAEAAR